MLIIRKIKSENGIPAYSYPTIKKRWGKFFGSVLFAGGLVEGYFTLNALDLWLHRPEGMSTFHPIFIIHLCLIATTCTYFTLGAYAFITDRRFARLTTYEQVCKRFGLEPEHLQNVALKHGIKPRCIVNGENYYDMKDFGDAVMLLRASFAPAAPPETLLRPVALSNIETGMLLRAAAPADVPEATQSLSTGRSSSL